MQKKIRKALALALAVAVVFLSACSGGSKSGSPISNGTYVPSALNLLAYDKVIFSGGDTAEFILYGVSMGKGSYEINGDTLIYSSNSSDITLSFSVDGKTLFLDEIEYVKQ